MTTLTEQLLARRKELKLSQIKAAKLAGVDDKTYIDLEHGTRGTRLCTVYAVADALGVEVTLVAKESEER